MARFRPVPNCLFLAGLALLLVAACTPAAPSPTAAPAKPAPTAAPAKADAPAAPAKPAAAPEKPAAAQPAAATYDRKAVEEFYAGKTVRVIVATTAGSLFDAWGRIMARHMPKYIPGNPNMIVENMPGAGQLIGANHIYNAAPKDGTVIGSFVETHVVNQLTGGKGIEFDMARFSWIGAVQPAQVACLVRTDIGSKVSDLNAMIGPNAKEVVFGTTGPGTNGYDFPFLMKELLGANIKLVSGYPGNQEVRAAIEKGEIEAYCATWDAVRRGIEPWKQAGGPPYKIIVQEGADRLPDLKDVPLMRELTKSEDDTLMLKIMSGPNNFARPYTAPPGIPADRLEALRHAFLESFKDPDLKAEAEKSALEFDPRSGTQVEAGMKEILATPKGSAERFTKIMAGRS